jgi:hypothetical protein
MNTKPISRLELWKTELSSTCFEAKQHLLALIKSKA